MATYTVEDKGGKIHDGITAEEAISIALDRNQGSLREDFEERDGVIYFQGEWIYTATDLFLNNLTGKK